MTSVLPPSASEDDDYAFSRKEPASARPEHEDYVATPRRTSVPVLVAVVVSLLVVLGTVLIVMMVWGGRVL